MSFKNRIGKLLRKCRLEKSWTQKDVVKRSGLTLDAISLIENGKYKGDFTKIEQYAELMDVYIVAKQGFPQLDDLEALFCET